MKPARRTRGGAPTPARSSIARGAAGSLLVALAGALTGCAVPVAPAAPVNAPAAVQVGDRPEPCRFVSQDVVADLAGDQRTQLVGGASTCSFTIGGRFTYQISVQPDAGGRFQSERDRLFRNSVPVQGVGDEAFYRDGTSLTVLGARKADTYFAVTLVPAVSDPAGAGGSPMPVAAGQARNQAQDQVDQAQAALADAADADGDGVVDADQDGDGQVDDGADADAVAAADTDGDGAVDDDVAAAVQAVADAADADDAADDDGAAGAGARSAAAASPGSADTRAVNSGAGADAAANAAGNAASVTGGGDDVAEANAAALGGIVDMAEAKARMIDVAQAVAGSV